jgi:2-C-methyl-D-erythritol 2,4-cyclodiphosphate synthase
MPSAKEKRRVSRIQYRDAELWGLAVAFPCPGAHRVTRTANGVTQGEQSSGYLAEQRRNFAARGDGFLSARYRIGQGFDVHRLEAGRKLVLGGVEIPYEKGLLGHSDADVLLHAFMNALLGALGKGDIGTHFPDSDPKYRGSSSEMLMKHVLEMVHASGYQIVNGDVTIITQRPQIAPHFHAIRRRMAKLLAVDEETINIKAGTMEGLGAIGEGRGMAALAVVLLHEVTR